MEPPAKRSDQGSVTGLLARWRAGDQAAFDQLVPIIYGELRRIASTYLSRERENHTLQPTALVNEAFLRLIGQDVEWQNRSHFIGVAAQMMRRVLVDHARGKQALKRGGDVTMIELSPDVAAADREYQILALDDALQQLATLDERQAKIVELRFFGGLTIEETAEAIGVSPATVKREWTMARAWLHREISRTGDR